VVVEEMAPGLWRWTERHPEWTPDAQGWGPDVGSVYCEADGDLLLVDPVLPIDREQRERFWRALDRDVARMATPPWILLTCHRHTRGSSEILARYAGATLWAPGSDMPLPRGVLAIEAVLSGEVLLWLPSHDALVAGDALVGGAGGDIRLCPDSWLGDRDPAVVRTVLWERLRGLPVERVLVSHGEPVPSGGTDALARALRGAP
jgi:glyoxylase-like metal-dependent hydrolase (beta-lactamase superfamily II)